MSMSRDFDAMLAEKNGERPTFVVAGQTFTLRSKLPYARWNTLVATMRDAELDNMEQTRRFFNTALVKADRQRFLDLLAVGSGEDDEDDDAPSIALEQMGPITDWVMEHFTGKLQSSSDSSSPGSNATGASPNVVSLTARTTAG